MILVGYLADFFTCKVDMEQHRMMQYLFRLGPTVDLVGRLIKLRSVTERSAT